MDYGKLTDHLGKGIDFTNVILIMTSNIGASELIKESVGFLGSKYENDNSKAINSFFSPEFRNRLDEVINFKMLNEKNSIKVVDKFLMELETLLVDKDMNLSVSSAAKKKLLELGFDIINGARPMARVIQEKIKVPLSEILLSLKKPLGTFKVDFDQTKDKFIIDFKPKKDKKYLVNH